MIILSKLQIYPPNNIPSHRLQQHYPYLPQTNLIVLNILLVGKLRFSFPVANHCYIGEGKLINQTTQELNLAHFSISSSPNKLTTMGCDTLGAVDGFNSMGKKYIRGCISLCDRLGDTTNGSCTDASFFQIPISTAQVFSTVTYGSFRAFSTHRDRGVNRKEFGVGNLRN